MWLRDDVCAAGMSLVGSQPIFRIPGEDSDDEDARPGPKKSMPSVTGEFSLRYDDETMVSKLDIGGQDQAQRYMSYIMLSFHWY